jgi:heme/copper-type cytochrome/quinol oxidase subunit 1
VLSMGAVFAMFAGFYHWFNFITGYTYDEVYGKVHFWLFFSGVDLTDFPDSYEFWNTVSTFGAIQTFVATLWFFYVIYAAFCNKNKHFN